MLYKIVKVISYLLLHLLYKVTVKGTENIPDKGPVIICANHIGLLDPFLIGCHIYRKLSFMAKAELFKNKLSAMMLFL